MCRKQRSAEERVRTVAALRFGVSSVSYAGSRSSCGLDGLVRRTVHLESGSFRACLPQLRCMQKRFRFNRPPSGRF
jgi:hypothetical protein